MSAQSVAMHEDSHKALWDALAKKQVTGITIRDPNQDLSYWLNAIMVAAEEDSVDGTVRFANNEIVITVKDRDDALHS